MRALGAAHRRLLPFVLLLGGPLPAGCANLLAVQEFARTSAATADYGSIVSDYATSPERLKRFQPAARGALLDSLAAVRAEQRARLAGAQSVLVAYLAALGDLAADRLPVVDAEVNALGAALTEAKFVGEGDLAISTETATAAGTVARILARASLDGWRRWEVGRLVKEADPSVQAVAAGLSRVVLTDFAASLDAEAEALEKYFRAPIADAESRGEPEGVPPLARIMLLEHQDQVTARRDRLKTYAGVLKRIGDGHADLCAHVGDLKGKELARRLEQCARDLRALARDLAETRT